MNRSILTERPAMMITLLALLASGCGSSAGTAAHGSPAVSASPTALVSAPTATRSPAASPGGSPSPSGAVAASLTCRLPVVSATKAGDPGPGGWVTFPGGQFVRDGASRTGLLQMHLPSYDRAIGAWVPVELEYVAPDGASYLIHTESSMDDQGYFYLVDARTGNRKLLLTKEGPFLGSYWTVVDYASEGIYLSAPAYGLTQPAPGLWLLNPLTGQVRLINGDHYWAMVAGGAAWGKDPPAQPGNPFMVYHLDLLTGNVITWYESKTDLRLLAPTPDGELLVDYGNPGSPRLASLAGSGLLVPIELPPAFPPIYSARMASQGVWLAIYGESWSGLALYVTKQGVAIMARSQFWIEAAGDCL